MKKTKGKISKTILGLSTIFSLFLTGGNAIYKTGTADILFETLGKTFKSLIIIIIMAIIFYFVIYSLFNIFNKIKANKKSSKIYQIIFEKHPFLTPFIIYLLIGIPILIFFYPGPVQWDGMRQLDYYFGVIAWSNHHPAFSTLVMGLCVKIGRILVNDNFGVFIFTFIQYILSCAVFSYITVFLQKIKAPKGSIVFSFLFFLINPLWYINSYTLIKDTMFYLFFILFFIEYIRAFQGEKRVWQLLLSSLLVFFFRNNGFYIILASFIVLLLFQKGYRKRNTMYIGLTIFTQIAFSIIISWCGITQGSIHEMLSVPLQQTARYINYYDVTNEEKEVLERLFQNNIEVIKEKYNPEISDPIKFMFEIEGAHDLIDYFKVWGQGLFKHPKVYFDAFFENYYGYVYPFKREYKDGLAYFDIEQSPTVNKGNFNFYMNDNFEYQRAWLYDSIEYLRNIPIIELIFNTGTYTWILLVFISYAIYKKRYHAIIIASPILFALAFCFLSPVNAYVRYMNPIIVTIPIYIGYVLSFNNKGKKEKK